MNDRGIDRLARVLASGINRRTLIKGIFAASLGGALARQSVRAAANEQGGLVYDYYQAIDRRDFSAAYACLGGKFTTRQSFQNFSSGFADTVHDELVVRGVHPDADHNRIVYDVTITAWHTDKSVHRFSGSYTEGREGGVTKLIDAAIAEIPVGDEAPLCTASDLEASMSGDAGAGQRYGTVRVVNTAGGVCVLGRVPKVTVADSSGHRLITGHLEQNTAITTIRLAPGDSAMLDMHWSNWCGDPVAGEPEVSVAFYGGNGRLTGLTGIAVPPCLSDPGGTSTLSVKPWQIA